MIQFIEYGNTDINRSFTLRSIQGYKALDRMPNGEKGWVKRVSLGCLRKRTFASLDNSKTPIAWLGVVRQG